ncbi:MAG TPA: hypothetical protein VKB26_07395 [Candidatus Acidoferrales bacterium]|nr:hypothetical protein [Candidatus Acidoferrales bacterium]
MKRIPRAPILLATLVALLFCPRLFAQSQSAPATADSDPISALTAALGAACRQNSESFSAYLTAANSAAFNKLPSDDRISLMERFVLLDTRGRTLLSNSTEGRPQIRCEATDATQEFTFGVPLVHDNLAYVPTTISAADTIRIGLVREDGNWKLLSLGMLLIDIPSLQKEWAAQALKIREQDAIDALQGLAQAVQTYQRAFGKLPDSLEQLGPPKEGGVSPIAAKLVDASLAAGSANGYKFRYRVVAPADSENPGFEIAAIPAEYGKTGDRSFLYDKDGKIHAADKKGAVATVDDPLIPTPDVNGP